MFANSQKESRHIDACKYFFIFCFNYCLLILTYFFSSFDLISRTCGLDNTCVLCSYCYNPDDHKGHQVIVTISQRDSGGVCDCGDPEAWVQHFSCKYHKLENFSGTPIAPDLEQAIISAVETAVDYVIDVLSTSDIPMQRFDSVEQILENKRISRLSENVYGVPDDATEDKYVLTIWNDQRHSMEEVVDLITLHLRKRKEFGDMVTKFTDSYGRAILYISGNLDAMLQYKHHMEKSGLIHTIRSTKDYFREEMCDCIIHWISDIAKASINGNYLVLGELVCKALCKPW